MASWEGLGLFGGLAGIDKVLDDAALNQSDALAGDPFPIKRHAKLIGMVDIVGYGDVLAEERLAYPAGEARALVRDRRCGEIVEQEADKIEDCRRFQDHGVAPRFEFDRILRPRRLFTG